MSQMFHYLFLYCKFLFPLWRATRELPSLGVTIIELSQISGVLSLTVCPG